MKKNSEKDKGKQLARELEAKYNFRFSKGLGQNFLISKSVLNAIIDGSYLNEEDCILEIGPGIGALTQELSLNSKKVLAVEIDTRLEPILKINLFGMDNITVVYEDVLKVDLPQLLKEHFGDQKAKVVANLPYYITTPIIMALLEEKLHLQSITVMVQKEVAKRMAAAPGGKEYGALSVAVQYYASTEYIIDVPPNSFVPEPGVDSAVIRLDIREKPPVEVVSQKVFFNVVKSSFGQRRKTLLNALSSNPYAISKDQIKEILESCGIDPQRRGETLSLQEFANIANKFSAMI